ncbi:hypothetical protein OIU79_014531 [Salix purpurea]|uniref:Uncharacterized protein n=1 Tax=Salix purpurea TaxID=77065 RepID=A0A9Q0PQW7_SALPP|nr:hypothetical protein OIU79_014531 [Salix purpurea]
MGFRLSAISCAKKILQLSPSAASKASSTVPKGCLAVYVGEIRKEEICSSDIILEPTYVPGLAKSSFRRIRISSSDGWYHNPMQRRHFS